MIGAPRPVANTNVEIVYVNNPIEAPQYQQYNQDTVPHRRDIISRSTGEEFYRSKIGDYENVNFGQRSPAPLPTPTPVNTPANTPKGELPILF
jgi:hypothetical protein